MDTREVDVAIIGAGSAGLNARREAEKAGARYVLIESGPYGTTCARVGCMPSKLLIAAADVANEIAEAGQFGIQVSDWGVSGAAVMDRVRRERDRFAGFVVESTEGLPEDVRLRGHARFVGPTSLVVNNHTRVEAQSVVVAAGSAPWVPPPFDAIREHVMVNDDVFDMTELPVSVAVVGTGIIGLELGQALTRLGVETVFFNPSDNLGPLTDPEVKKVTAEVLHSELDLRLNSEVLAATPVDGGVKIRWRDSDGEETTHVFEKVLAAAGRRPNLAGLDLQTTGLELNERGAPSWDPTTTQCGDSPIFLAGDISSHLPLLHEAADEGRIAGHNAVHFPEVTAHLRRTPLAVAFTDPQIGMVGSRYADLDEGSYAVGEVSFADQGRSRVMARNRGLLRVYADTTCCRLIGAEMIGPRVEHMAHLLSWSVQQGLTVVQALEMPFYHPVVEEGLRTALRDLAKNLRVVGNCRCEDMAEAPGC